MTWSSPQGGLGPTEDDLTRQAVANVAGVELEFRQELMDQIEEIFRRSGYKMVENNRRQAFVPAGSRPIPNPVGTAPAFITEVQKRPVICLPGVPRELKYLLSREVLPWIKERFILADQVIMYRVLKVVGTGESAVDRLIGDLITEGKNPEVGLLASPGEITIRLTAKARDPEEARSLIQPVQDQIRERLGEKIYGEDEETLERVIDNLLARRNRTLAILETFSGGLAALRLHQLPSDQLISSLVVPNRKGVSEWLGRRDIQASLETARDLAHRVKEKAGADIGLASLGFPMMGEKGYQLKAHNVAAGEGITKEFSWQMGGDVPSLQQRGSVICLNTLRLALTGFSEKS